METKIENWNEVYEEMGSSEKRKLLEIYTQIESRLINIKKDSFQIGKLLWEAKKVLPHGMFAPWIKKTFKDELPYTTAAMYMRIYRKFKDYERAVPFIPAKYMLMMINNGFPEESRNFLAEKIEGDEKGLEIEHYQKINEFFQLLKKGTIGPNQFNKLMKEQIQMGIDLYKGKSKVRINRNMRESVYFGAGDVLERIQALISLARSMTNLYPHDPESKLHIDTMKKIKDIIARVGLN